MAASAALSPFLAAASGSLHGGAFESPPPFPKRPPRRARSTPREGIAPLEADIPARTPSPPPPRRPPLDLELPSPPPGFEMSRRTRTAALPPLAPAGLGRRVASTGPLEAVAQERTESQEPIADNRSEGRPHPPAIRNLAAFDRPRSYMSMLQRTVPGQPVAPARSRCSAARSRCASIDEAVRRELLGDGVALDQAVASRRKAGWAVQQRHVQRSDVGHCCHSCRQPFRDLNDEVTVWTGAAIYRRFHPSCAASFMLRAEMADAGHSDVVEGYADGWRALPRSEPTQAARQWLLSQDPSAWPALRGDLFTTVTMIENGQKKAVPGLSHEQLRTLQSRHKWRMGEDATHDEEPAECAICFADFGEANVPCVRLPCAPQHVFHVNCVLPWLRKASLCPVCRKDLRPLLPAGRGATRSREAPSPRT